MFKPKIVLQSFGGSLGLLLGARGGALVPAIDALIFVSFLSSFFDVVFYLLSEPLGGDFKLPN